MFLRHVRDRNLTRRQARELHDLFRQDVREGAWTLLPVTSETLRDVEDRLRRLRKSDVFLRAGDAIHLSSARQAGFRVIWTNDRHLLAAAPRFGLRGRSA